LDSRRRQTRFPHFNLDAAESGHRRERLSYILSSHA
jgi:hypothetical protein